MNKSDFVIAGSGPAGITAVEIIRKLNPEAHITLIGNESPPLYARMATPYYLSNITDESGILLREADFLEKYTIKPHLGKKVTGLDTGTKTVTLSDGERIAYGKLLLATGSSPSVPAIKGAQQPGVYYNWTREDAKNLLSRSREATHAVIVGSGFIGLQLVHSLVTKGVKVTLIEIAPQILPTMLDRMGAEIVEDFLREKGVNLFTGCEIADIIPNGDLGKIVTLPSGIQIRTDMLIMATGVRPNLDYLKGTNLAVDKGLLVDEQMRTSQPDVFAAGDIAQAFDLIEEKPVVHALWPVAVEQGRVAGYNMAGKLASYSGGFSYNILDVLNLSAARIGLLYTDDNIDVITHLKPDRRQYRRYSFLKGRLVGCLMVGNLDGIGMIKGLIQSKRDLSRYISRLKQEPLALEKLFISANWIDSTLWKR